jgi:hypothetical protein
MPHLKALVERHDASEFTIFGINTDADADMFRSRREEDGIHWPNIFAGGTDGEAPKAWGVRAYPTTYVLDAEGVIRAINPRGKELEDVVDKLVAKAAAGR